MDTCKIAPDLYQYTAVDDCTLYRVLRVYARRSSPGFDMLLAEWQHYYIWERPHSAHKGKTPMERYCELMEQSPVTEDVAGNYHPEREHIHEQNYSMELRLRRLK